MQAGRQTGRQADRQTDRQTDRQADRQTDRQTDRQSDRHTEVSRCPTNLALAWANLISSVVGKGAKLYNRFPTR